MESWWFAMWFFSSFHQFMATFDFVLFAFSTPCAGSPTRNWRRIRPAIDQCRMDLVYKQKDATGNDILAQSKRASQDGPNPSMTLSAAVTAASLPFPPFSSFFYLAQLHAGLAIARSVSVHWWCWLRWLIDPRSSQRPPTTARNLDIGGFEPTFLLLVAVS